MFSWLNALNGVITKPWIRRYLHGAQSCLHSTEKSGYQTEIFGFLFVLNSDNQKKQLLK